jgi:histidinol dehydrogenase
MRQLRFGEKQFKEKLAAFAGNAVPPGSIRGTVAEILSAVAQNGDQAVLEYTRKFDRADLSVADIRVAESELKGALRSLSKENKTAFRESIAAVEEFHKPTLPKSWQSRNRHGAIVGERYDPLTRIGLYIPGGNVPLVSTVIMTAVLAKVARVPEIAVATPPDAQGRINPSLLAALQMVGVREVYRMGGVQAMAAMAYGTRTVAPVVKLFGPGNAYVMEAKRQLFGVVGVDLLPGPSELMIISDDTANPDWVAADLLAQAEHGSGKEKLYLVVWSDRFLKKVQGSIRQQISSRTHAEKIRKVLDDGTMVITVSDEDQAIETANFLAPEHLEIQTDNTLAQRIANRVVTAGALLIGHYSPAALGDFAAGPSHTLPTNRSGLFLSGLKISDFFRRSSILKYNQNSIRKASPTVSAFSRMENLDAHGYSVEVRL